MTDRIADPWGTPTPFARGGTWPQRVDQQLEGDLSDADVEHWVHSACVLCSNGCACDIAVRENRIVGVRGRAGDRVNHGRLGPKGLFGWQANNAGDRVTAPLIRRDGRLVEASWEDALDQVTSRCQDVLRERGPLSVGFYTTGQLFLEEYYTLAVLARGGIGTPHLDGNTRLCTSTAAFALMESFGMDGQPGSYTDIDHCDALLLVGHNVAETQTVLWARMRDRLEGPDRPRLVVIDPRRTVPARMADVHLAIRNGTNVACLNAIQQQLIEHGWVDTEWVNAHTQGYDDLRRMVSTYTPEHAAEICGVDAADIRRAAEVIGHCTALVSTVLQGVYQSHQATAAACQVNNINLLRGMIGKPGATVIQMNGQPTAENTRETGADGALPAFRNWQNDDHVRELASIWDVDPMQIPHWAPPTHAMQIFRLCESGAIRFLWIIGTNPAVSLPELHRIRSILEQERLFVVVSDAFLTETAMLADVVLPAALWGEKTGTFTNTDRTVHLSEKAVEPPGSARSDLDILCAFASRLDLRTRSDGPLVHWSDAQGAFDAWKQCSAGRPCDYTGLTYNMLREGGVQWPVNSAHPQGTERLYTDSVFWTDPSYCQNYGHDFDTGAANTRVEYTAQTQPGKAFLRAAEQLPLHEPPSEKYPLRLTTGRTVYHFHTRTKTRHAPQLQEAAPSAWAELHPADARARGVAEGDIVRVVSPRGTVECPARLSGIREGVVFVPFHYGYWDSGRDQPGDGTPPTAANELTITEWDPVSKQPLFKVAAVQVERVREGTGAAAAPTVGAPAPVGVEG